MSQNKEISMFEVGQLVQCIDASDWGRGPCPELRQWAIYRVAAIFNMGGLDGLEVEGANAVGRGNFGFRTSRFRPLPSSQIALINSMLVMAKDKERV